MYLDIKRFGPLQDISQLREILLRLHASRGDVLEMSSDCVERVYSKTARHFLSLAPLLIIDHIREAQVRGSIEARPGLWSPKGGGMPLD